MEYDSNDEIEEIILDEDEVLEDETDLDEDSKSMQMANLSAKRSGEATNAPVSGGGVANASATGAGSGKYAGLYKDGTGGGAIVPEPVDTGLPSGDAKKKFDASVRSKKAMRSENIDVHMDAMFDGEELTEDFKNKAATIFEAAINERVEAIRTELEEEYSNRLVSEIESSKNALTEQLDSYLSYVVKEWVEENRLAVEKGIRTEVAESFMDGLRSLFQEHDIMVPESKVDVADQLAETADVLKSRLDEEMRRNIELTEQVAAFRRSQILDEMSEDLTLSQKERFRTLAEGVSVDSDEGNIRRKLGVIRESYFGGNGRRIVLNEQTAATLTEGIDEDPIPSETQENLSESMRVYADTLRRISKR